jgi:hypothetical protein
MCSGTASATDSQIAEKCDFSIVVSSLTKVSGFYRCTGTLRRF